MNHGRVAGDDHDRTAADLDVGLRSQLSDQRLKGFNRDFLKVIRMSGILNKEIIDAALAKIRAIVTVPEIGEVYEGTVRSIMPYGCFVEIKPGKDGLLHISEIDWKRLETVEEAGIKEGDKIQVKLLEIDPKTGKYKLSRKVLMPKPEGYVERERPERRPRPERGDRGDRGDRRDRGDRGGDRRFNDRGDRPERRPRPERSFNDREEFHDNENREPKDFNDSLDHNNEID